MPEHQTFYISTFGCRTNQADSAAVREDFLSRGFRETDDWSSANIIIINSCTVTHRSDQQVRQMVRRLRRENEEAQLYVTGCYAQRDASTLARISGINAVVGNTHKSQLLQIAVDHETGPSSSPGRPAAVYRGEFGQSSEVDLTHGVQLGGRTRPYVKIQDGCDAQCTYCIIPAVRGPGRSVPPSEILQQVRDLVARGFKEVVITGIHIGTYGMQFKPRYPLDRLLEDILEINGLQQMRISAIEPMQLSRRVIRLAAHSDGRIVPHFHICLQSGCNRTLKKMLRPYTTQRFAEIAQEVRGLMPDAGIGTDVITGFPGETDQDHQEGLEFIEQMPFTYLHVFPYSDRTGTQAEALTDKVDPETIHWRSRELREISDAKHRAFRRSFLGRRLSVITLEEEKDGSRTALSGNYLKAKLSRSFPANQILELNVVGMEGDYLLLE